MRQILMALALTGALVAQEGIICPLGGCKSVHEGAIKREEGWPASYGSAWPNTGIICNSVFILAEDIDGRLVPVPCGDMGAHNAAVDAERKRRAAATSAIEAADARLVRMEKAIEALRAQVAALVAKLEAK